MRIHCDTLYRHRKKQHEKVDEIEYYKQKKGAVPKPRLFNNNTHYKIEILNEQTFERLYK